MRYPVLIFILLGSFQSIFSQSHELKNPVNQIIEAYDTSSIVAFGERHDIQEITEFYLQLFRDTSFQKTVDDIVLELGNSLYQETLDRYIQGENIPYEEVRKVWFNATNSLLQFGPGGSTAILIKNIRLINEKLPDEHKFRVIAADPPVDWDQIKEAAEFWPYLGRRDRHFATVIWDEVIDKKRKAFVIMGRRHLFRKDPKPVNYINLVDLLESRLDSPITIVHIDSNSELVDPKPQLIKIANSSIRHQKVYSDFELTYGEAIDAIIYLGPLQPILIEPFSAQKDLDLLNQRSQLLGEKNFQFNSYDYLNYFIQKYGLEGVKRFYEFLIKNPEIIDYNEVLVKMVANDSEDQAIKKQILESMRLYKM